MYNKANQLMRADTPHGATIFEYDKRGNVSVYRYDKAHRLMNIVQGIGTEAVTSFVVYQ